MDCRLHRFLSVTFSRDFADIAARNAIARRVRDDRPAVAYPALRRLAPLATTPVRS